SWRDAMQLLDEIPDAYCHGDPGRGVVRCVIPPGARADMSTLRRCITSPFTGTRIVETLPAELWPLVAPSAANNRLSHGIKRAFDPAISSRRRAQRCSGSGSSRLRRD